jgi:hypothetical protein
MKFWSVVLVSVAALCGVVLMIYLSWLIFNGKSEVECISTAYAFGCFTHAADLLGLVAVLEIAAGTYLWKQFRGY